MLNDKNVKNSCSKYQLKQMTKTREKKCCNQWKLHSEKSGLKSSKAYLQDFVQISTGEQAKVDE